VDDLAKLAIEQGKAVDDCIIDAVGPETFTYRELVNTLGTIIGKRRPVLRVPSDAAYIAGAIIGRLMGDVMITRDEIKGLMADLLHVDSPPAADTCLSSWASEHADRLGLRYASELARRKNRLDSYEDL